MAFVDEAHQCGASIGRMVYRYIDIGAGQYIGMYCPVAYRTGVSATTNVAVTGRIAGVWVTNR